MSEPAKALNNTHSGFVKKSDHFAQQENIRLVDVKTGIDFFNGQYQVEVANRLILRQKAYELLYDLYSKMEITQKKDHGLWLSIYDALPETTTFVAKNDQGYVEGALTVVFDSHIGMPADELYKKEIDELRAANEQICEFVSLGIREKVKSRLKVLASLFYCAFLHAWWRNDSRDLIITVHSRFEKFYRRNVFFDKIGPERQYAKVNGAPTVLLKLALKRINSLRQTQRIFPFSLINYSDQTELEVAEKIENMVQPMSDEEFYVFFIEKTDTWETASAQQKEYIKKAYPAHAVNHYEVSRALAKGFSGKNRYAEETLNPTARLAQQ